MKKLLKLHVIKKIKLIERSQLILAQCIVRILRCKNTSHNVENVILIIEHGLNRCYSDFTFAYKIKFKRHFQLEFNVKFYSISTNFQMLKYLLYRPKIAP